jgi:hypothetical protein
MRIEVIPSVSDNSKFTMRVPFRGIRRAHTSAIFHAQGKRTAKEKPVPVLMKICEL